MNTLYTKSFQHIKLAGVTIFFLISFTVAAQQNNSLSIDNYKNYK